MRNILIVEDDADLSRVMSRAFEAEGFKAVSVLSAEDAYVVLTDTTFDCLIVDINLPGDDGFSFCRTLRERSGAPVIFASARLEPDARVRALEGGGDAYLSKPFSLRELIAQAKALMRRPERRSLSGTETVVAGPFTLNDEEGVLFKHGEQIALSPKEFLLASTLMHNPGKAFSKDALLSRVWGAFSEVEPQTVAVHMSWLRSKLEDEPADPVYFKTVRGFGYLFDIPDEDA